MENIYTVEAAVTEDMLACAVGSGSLRVLATPAVAALMEKAAAELCRQYLDEGITSVGVSISIEHTAPTPLGGSVKASAELLSAEGRSFNFKVTAFDGLGKIAEGTHTRVSVKAQSFQEKADGRREK